MSILSFTKKIAGRTKADAPAKGKKSPEKKTKPVFKHTQLAQATGVLGLMPLITEKSVGSSGAAQTVVFRVRPHANKGQISAAIAARYGVAPTSVRTMQMMSKRRTRGNSEGRTNTWKKAYVTLPAGKTIDFSV